MAVLSIQSHVAVGHVGNSAAAFALRRLGVDVWPVHTARFSNHPGYGAYRGRAAAADEVGDLLEGVRALDRGRVCEAVLSGYLGSVENGRRVLDAVGHVKQARPDAVYGCDPVLGDAEEGLYVDDGLVAFFRDEAFPAADVVFPNAFELQTLSGLETATTERALAAAGAIRAQGPAIVIATSLRLADTPADLIHNLAVTGSGAWRVSTPSLSTSAKGSGDLLAALWLGHSLRGADPGPALGRAVSSVYGLIEAAGEARELPLVAGQELLVDPGPLWPAEEL